MDDLLRLLMLHDANTRTVLLGTAMLGVACGVAGAFAVLRRRALMGDAAAHAALPGICLAYFIVGDRSFAAFMGGALVCAVLAAAFVSMVRHATRIKEDAAIALAIGGFFGVGIVLSRIIQNTPAGNRAGLDGFIFGKAASMVAADTKLIGGAAAVVVAVIALSFKEFKLLCFDRDFAASQGRPVYLLDLLLMGLVCLCTVAGLPAVGVVLVVALLVIPPAAARFWSDRLSRVVVLAAAFGGFAGAAGTMLSAVLPAPASALARGWPTGPLITLVAASVFVGSMLVAPRRGVLADLHRRMGLRRRIAVQHVLRSVFELLERGGELGRDFSPDDPQLGRRLSAAGLARARRAGYIVRVGDGFRLTPEGLAAARQVVRAHRLWEIFLVEQADIAPDHVDRDADDIEHLLPPHIIAELEARLAAAGRSPAAVPASPHPLGEARS